MRKIIRKIVLFIILFLFFFIIFTLFNLAMKIKLILSAILCLFFLAAPFIASKINIIHARRSLKKIRNDAVKGYHITPKEAEKLFFLDKNTNICINKIQLKKCNISEETKEILLKYFESPL